MVLQRCFATVALIGFSPVMTVVAALILLEDGRPLLYLQSRTGHHRTKFTVLKFRSMRNGSVTRAGRWLRASGLDELPQLINIIRGEMAVVGPRALTDEDVTRLGWDTRRFDRRWSIKPGLTGLAQVIGGRDARHSYLLDLLYIKRRTLWFDLKIIAISFLINLVGRGSARRLLGM